jgi:hypothetical protein
MLGELPDVRQDRGPLFADRGPLSENGVVALSGGTPTEIAVVLSGC